MSYKTSGLLTFALVVSAEILLTEAEFQSKFLSFIESLNKVEQFQSIFLFKNSEDYFDDQFLLYIATSLNVPVILSTEDSSFYLKGKFNENLLTIVQFDFSDLFLQPLLEHLQHLRFCKTIFVLKNSSRNDTELKSLFKFCWRNRLINVVAVFQDFCTSSTYYSYSHFGGLNIEEIVWNNYNSVVFRDKMKNLKGFTLPVVFGGPEPGLIISKNSNSEIVIRGYMGHFFNTFAKKHNARLNTSNVNTSLTARNLYDLVVNSKIEISGAFPSRLIAPVKYFSYPFFFYKWSIMLPIEKHIPIFKVFSLIFQWKALLLTIVVIILLSALLEIAAFSSHSPRIFTIWDFLFNIDCFRGILGQPFSQSPKASLTTKIIYSLVFLLGIMIVTSYDGFLQSFMTEPPRENMIRTFEDLEAAGLKVYIITADYNLMLSPHFKKYSNIFKIEPDFATFIQIRDNLSPKYAYTVNSEKWKIYKMQQSFSGIKMFRWSDELCLNKNLD
ncbi:uncharacterized protein LOC129918088 [Episyrphus balteatus]|uniref:uncharacterized protein LOC129918088 n=1 Tax=Episyrphus balteatus TaxID=286459 RepID=UPI0024863B4A|nr:uncharacterized protein LOC129918088 [Episyrphus balteatus]